MEIIKILRKYNNAASLNLWHVRVGGVSMTLFLLFALGEKFVVKLVPMEPTTAEIVSEVMNFIACAILGGAIIVALAKLTPRRRWAVLATMAGSFAVGLIISGIFALIDGNNDKIWELMPMLGVSLALFVAAVILWRINVNKIKRIKFERELARQRRKRER